MLSLEALPNDLVTDHLGSRPTAAAAELAAALAKPYLLASGLVSVWK